MFCDYVFFVINIWVFWLYVCLIVRLDIENEKRRIFCLLKTVNDNNSNQKININFRKLLKKRLQKLKKKKLIFDNKNFSVSVVDLNKRTKKKWKDCLFFLSRVSCFNEKQELTKNIRFFFFSISHFHYYVLFCCLSQEN